MKGDETQLPFTNDGDILIENEHFLVPIAVRWHPNSQLIMMALPVTSDGHQYVRGINLDSVGRELLLLNRRKRTRSDGVKVVSPGVPGIFSSRLLHDRVEKIDFHVGNKKILVVADYDDQDWPVYECNLFVLFAHTNPHRNRRCSD